MSDICKGCGASIRWIKTTKGKKMPVDPEDVTIVTRGGVIYKGFIPHWATCPEAKQFKAKTKPTGGIAHLQWQCPTCKEWFLKGIPCRNCGTLNGGPDGKDG